MKARISVRLKPAILDPQGKAVLRSLQQLGFSEIKSVRIGKLVELEIDDSDPDRIRPRLDELSSKLLANPLMEVFDIELTEDNGASD